MTGNAKTWHCFEQVLEGSMSGVDEERQVHVVAPCPHDGACPMEGTGSWCHFVQRFRRSTMQRIAKIRPDGGLARDYQACPPPHLHHAQYVASFTALGQCLLHALLTIAGAGLYVNRACDVIDNIVVCAG